MCTVDGPPPTYCGLCPLAGATCRPCPQGWLWSGEHCYYLSAEAQAWEASQAFCLAHHATLPLLSHTQVRRGWAREGCGRLAPEGIGKDLVQLYITEKVTKAWRNKVTCRGTGLQVAQVFSLLILGSRCGAGAAGARLPPLTALEFSVYIPSFA